MDGEAGWWTTSRNIGLPPLARVMGVGRQQQWRASIIDKGLKLNSGNTKVMVGSIGGKMIVNSGKCPGGVCGKTV